MFDFIQDDGLRASVEADYRELGQCMQCGAWKAAHVLAGSVVEAILIDHLLSMENRAYSSSDVLNMDLGKAVSACLTEGILTQRVSDLSTVIRSYRNLIHPGRTVRLSESVSESSAKVAQALVDMIVQEVSVRARQQYGYSAEQLVTKLESDPRSPASAPAPLAAIGSRT